MLNSCIMAGAGIRISVDGENFDSCSEAACQKIIGLFRELERISSNDEGINITINVTHGSRWTLGQSIEALKSCGLAGIDYLIGYGQAGLDYLRSQGGEGWKYIEACGAAGLNFLKVCGMSGLEYILSEGADGWEYLKKCGDAGLEFLKSLGSAALYILLNTEYFPYFTGCFGINGLDVLMPYAEEALRYLAANGSDAWEYLKDCGAKGFEFLKSCGQAGLDYILSFGKAGLDYLMSFGEDGWNFLMSYYDTPKVIRGLSGDVPALGKVSPNDDKSVKNYLEAYKTLGRDVFDTYGNDALDVLREWTPGGNNSAGHDSIIDIDTVIPDSVNINEAYEVKKFLEADSLEWIDFVPDFRDREYFREGSLTFCREYPNSLSSYGFADSEYLADTIKKFYGGGFSVHDSRNFTFRLSGNTILWNSTIKSAGENAFYSLKTLRPVKSGDVITLALRLLQTVKNKKIGSRHAARLFFRTNCDWLRFVAVIREGVPPTYYLAGNRPLLERNSLPELLMDKERIALDTSNNTLTFCLLKSDSRLNPGAELDTCLNVFIGQILRKLEGKN